MKLDPVTNKTKLRLSDRDASPPDDKPDGDKLKDSADKHFAEIGELQAKLFADQRYALLVVLQGRDASGKDGTIRRVFSDVNPQGCEVTSFKKPTELEARHDFLWRVHMRVPQRGIIGIFNRSHYEDILVPRVLGQLTDEQLEKRIGAINDFERMLTDNNVVVLKFFLHISKDEQKARLQDRLEDETENWKFSPGDIGVREQWDQYTEAYRDALQRCSTEWAPWYVVPADSKKYRNYLIADAVAQTLRKLDLRYPKANPEVLATEIK
jgi:PPK2 family polyphosphate:nucleotide phosphotransferase